MPLPIPTFSQLLKAAKSNQLVVSLVIMIMFCVWFANVWHDTSTTNHNDNKESIEAIRAALIAERKAHKEDNDKKDSINLQLQAELKQVRTDQDAERKMLLQQLLNESKKKK